MRVLHVASDGWEPAVDARWLGRDLGLDDLAVLYAVPPAARSWLRVNMVSTLDGAATGADGRSGSINTPADQVVFEVLRALADAVMVGAGTIRAEGYPPLRLTDEYAALRAAAGLPEALPLVVVSRSGALPERLLEQSEDAPVHAMVPASCPTLRTLRGALGDEAVHVVGDEWLDLAAGVSVLHEIGWRRVHSEGGPTLLGDLVRAGLVDELDLTLAPSLVGGPFRRIAGGGPITPPARFRPTLVLEQQGSLIGRWQRH